VAEKSRQKAKKGSTGMSRRTNKKSAGTRRTSHSASRGSVRSAAPAAKITGSPKGAGEGVLPGMPSNKKTTQRQGFKTNEFIVYPAHGVGQILAIEEQEIAGAKLELFVINFIKDKMTLRVPTAKIVSVGMRKLAEAPLVKRALETLKGRARIKRTMWSRRAQEYEAKINSGDIVAIAEVVRDLFRSDSQPEQSYSERQLYEAALDRLSREIAAVQKITETEAVKEIEGALAKGPRRGPKPAEEADAEPAAEEEAA
jgi:CarD family transcriptional regulator